MRRKRVNWTNEDIEKLKSLYGTITNKELGKLLDRDPRTIGCKAHFLKLGNRRKFWSDEDILFVKRYYSIYSLEKIGRAINKSPDSVQVKAHKMGITSIKNKKDRWTDEENNKIRELYKYFPARIISQKINRPMSSIYHQASRLRLTKMFDNKSGEVRRNRKTSHLWRIISESANKRDLYKCVICGYDKHIATHHIHPVRYGGSNILTNLITLCPNHHKEADMGELSQSYLLGLIDKV